MKSGFLTSEFWITIVTQVVGLLIFTGRLSPSDAQHVSTVLSDGVKGLVDAITALYMLFTAVHYIQGRFELKKAALNPNAVIVNQPAEQTVVVK